MIAVPLVLASLIVGIANLGDVSKLSRMGGKTILTYLATTTIAITIGLILVNIIQPGKKLPESTRENLMSLYSGDVENRQGVAQDVRDAGPLQPLVDIVPQNVFEAFSDNGAMLKVVFVALIIGVALLQVPRDKGQPVIAFFDGLNDVIIKIVEFIMLLAPYGVFALIAALIVEIGGENPNEAFTLLYALLWYTMTVIIGLLIMVAVIYPAIFKMFVKVKYKKFFRAMRPAQLLAFSTSSSAATLPVTMEVVQNDLKVSEEVSSFVPTGQSAR
ncbi:MAG: dicarboxylate/amino acid:cation symporter, partial [Bacteroidota bacterium]